MSHLKEDDRFYLYSVQICVRTTYFYQDKNLSMGATAPLSLLIPVLYTTVYNHHDPTWPFFQEDISPIIMDLVSMCNFIINI